MSAFEFKWKVLTEHRSANDVFEQYKQEIICKQVGRVIMLRMLNRKKSESWQNQLQTPQTDRKRTCIKCRRRTSVLKAGLLAG